MTEQIVERLLYTVEEVARSLGLGRTKVYELMKAGDLVSVRIGHARRIPAESLTAFVTRLLASNEDEATYPQAAQDARELSLGRGTMPLAGRAGEAS
jgi:excisionase family DNA binding protein